MKKTFVALLVLASLASAADYTIDSSTTGPFYLYGTNNGGHVGSSEAIITVTETASIDTISGYGLNNITNIDMTIASGKTLTVTGDAYLPFRNTDNKTYKAVITLNANSQLVVNKSLYLGSWNNNNTHDMSQQSSIVFGDGASVTVKALRTVQYSETAKNSASLTLTADFAAGAMRNICDGIDVVEERTLVTAETLENFSASNVMLTNIAALDSMGFSNVGVITDKSKLNIGEYGILMANNDLTLVARAPEPATATLSLLALAGLAARRRRH